jgi:CRISPR-associated protein Csm3
VFLTEQSAKALDETNSDLRYAELKTELERVPAGAVFGPAELVFGIYGKADYDRLKTVVQALQLVEDDYLGGAGSRGSGKVRFQSIRVFARKRDDYSTAAPFESTFDSVQALADKFDTLKAWLAQNVPAE